ncbi:hypothetical protein GUITHDRAFT_158071 [Guillardia theta CCMP2712]|uniref:RING finger and CHY zinc finger domain-containing protein 1 n=1 Tax=Guillardia theta (strain CCMP2712) TaxID=905079 RepID=L1J3T7_GUITC|nr:hypothetical protein GUITHDRAFT_158071 [Guillardia theta CCMP2712]EKX43181.1 hypothetical protein GUITHDRAFT_158071 [Guillardia theta CCMP2712]|eukprot:XP_005830161.1 hypothetical protein GUITHDRAFT_158071 [Guillardia theta CCMP2712]
MPYNTNYTELDAQLKNETDARRGCRHYSRGCRLRAPCCNELFWCRHCHNEVKDAGCKDPLKAHQLDRFSVKFVRCSRCDLEQTTKQFCEGCGLCFGAYYCDVCKENFFHCLNCGCCYAMQLRDNHRCIAGAMRHNCPVCLEDLFHSTSQVRVLRCGHTLHKKCLEKLLTSKTIIHTCPLCSKTLIDHTFHWRQMDLALAQTPMPEEFANKSVGVLCNDCQTKGTTTFHVLGLKCPNPQCGGYNTRRIDKRQGGGIPQAAWERGGGG